MINFPSVRRLVTAVAISFALCSVAFADQERAWQALHDLEIAEAKELFQQELTKSRKDLSVMRGLLLAAYFDLDYDTQFQMVKAMVKADPRNPYLVPVFEHVADKLTGWSDQPDLERQIGEALSKHADRSLAHTGKHLCESYYRTSVCKPPSGWHADMGYAPGCWVAGPFENRSQIAAYRPVPFEGEPLDTLATVTGKNGSRAGWTWLPSDHFGDFIPHFCVENAEDIACQFRAFFELPSDMEVLVLPGGVYNCRVLIDGKKIYDDPTFRNAVQREGFHVGLQRGTHEITLVLGMKTAATSFRIAILDTNYQPISDLKWRRYADVPIDQELTAETIHSIFDPFDAHVAASGEEPDTRYWKAVLRTFNGYAAEAVRELEKLFEAGDLSLLETWALYESLEFNEEPALSLEYLSQIKERASSPKTDLDWISATVENYEAKIKDIQELNDRYPGRFDLEFLITLRPMLNQDMKTLLSELEALQTKYDRSASISAYMAWVYQYLVHDPESAYRKFTEFCKVSKSKAQEITESGDYFVRMRKYDKAIRHARRAVETFTHRDWALLKLFAAHRLARREEELISMMEDVKTRFPYNIELHSVLHQIYSSAGRFDDAERMLREIHELKPSALRPYQSLDSLHNHVPYDSIFGSADLMAFWDVQPSEAELAGNNHWYLFDRRQKIVFESGMVLSDIHWAAVLENQETVEQFQETYLGFDPEEQFATLLAARRLRKGEPPLAGTTDGMFVIFKDLQPKDAVEVHYRIWESREGDLWREFWDDYRMLSETYQRYWEYTILTNRDDLDFVSTPPASQPVIGEHCGFKKISWKGEKTPALDINLAILPPLDDLAGKMFLSTTSDWEALNHWYTSISEAILGENPRADELADRLTAGKASDQEKLQALYEYVVLEIPYQLITFDYHSSIPHKPDDVLVNRWGDCKDKTHLLIQMLRHVGVEAWPVLVMTRDSGTRMPLPQFRFDHLITCCLIDGDTMFVDPTELPSPPNRSLNTGIAGQPYVLVGVDQNDPPRRLPSPKPQDHSWSKKMRISPRDDDLFDFVYEETFHNLEAGYRRYELRGYSQAELKKEIESVHSEDWGVVLSLDSITYDPLQSVDSVFNETWHGRISLNTQSIGPTTIVSPPRWSTIPIGLLSLIEGDQKRQHPADLREVVGRFEKTLELSVPAAYGAPQLLDPVELEDSLMRFSFHSKWDRNSRTLSLHYTVETEDGLSDPEAFLAFSRKVIETFDSPLLFRRE